MENNSPALICEGYSRTGFCARFPSFSWQPASFIFPFGHFIRYRQVPIPDPGFHNGCDLFSSVGSGQTLGLLCRSAPQAECRGLRVLSLWGGNWYLPRRPEGALPEFPGVPRQLLPLTAHVTVFTWKQLNMNYPVW